MKLPELIATHRQGRSYGRLEHDSGGRLGAARWAQLASGDLRTFPSPNTIRCIAEVLAVPEETVLLATGDSLGITPQPRSRIADLLPAGSDHLSDQAVAAVVHVVRAMCALQEYR